MAELVVLLDQPNAFQIFSRGHQHVEAGVEWNGKIEVLAAIGDTYILATIRKSNGCVAVLKRHSRDVEEVSRPDNCSCDQKDGDSLPPIPLQRVWLPSARLQDQHQGKRQYEHRGRVELSQKQQTKHRSEQYRLLGRRISPPARDLHRRQKD